MIALEGVRKSFRTGKGRTVVIDDATALFETGRSYGILASKGAGKTTLLRLIAGTDLPDAGRVRRKARVSWPIGFKGAFQRKLTPRENIRFLARVYGEDAKRLTSFVQEFSEVGAGIDRPVSTCPGPMRARLAFGLSMAIGFDRYLVDEVVAVGDARFQKRCLEVFEDRRRSADVIMVSHSPQALKSFCDVGAILADGHLRIFEDVDKAASRFQGPLMPGAGTVASDDEGDEE